MAKFLIEYNHGGSCWCSNLHADTWAEAERKLQSLKTNARIVGESVMEVPVPTAAGNVFVRLLNWWRG